MKPANEKHLKQLIDIVNHRIQGIEYVAQVDQDRAYGGIIRSAKGKLLEELCKELVTIAWDELGGDNKRLSFSNKRVDIPLRKEYINKIKSDEVKKWISDNYPDFVFKAQVDNHTMIDDKFVLGIECKAYTENAMLKRILVDFTLLKSVYKNLKCALLQFESQLTGDYSDIDKPIILGSHSSHTLMSHFDVDLHIMTLIKGERKVDEPIHKAEFFKPLTYEAVIKCIEHIKSLLEEYK